LRYTIAGSGTLAAPTCTDAAFTFTLSGGPPDTGAAALPLSSEAVTIETLFQAALAVRCRV
jgi:hypothetical protein